jgi:stage V sporulation protein R
LNADLEKRFEEIEALARRMGLDPFPVCFEEVPREMIWDVASYGLPTRMSHWSFGRSYSHQKTYGEMGYSKIYELILNNDPSYAFLDDTNSDVVNMLIAAHCFAHSDFFKHNMLFAHTNRNMVNQAEANAKTIDGFKEKYGVEAVENWMDIAFSVDAHIDFRLGETRDKYPAPEHVFRTKHPLPYADLFGEADHPQVVEEVRNTSFPPHSERDILWFLINYAQLLPWQREILSMIRSEAFYFWPQGQTKIINEGHAAFWHAELMLNYESLKPEEHLEFAKAHSQVVNPGQAGSLNPYYVGFRLFTDIKKRWDKYYEEGKKDAAFQAKPDIDLYDKDGKVVASKIDGLKKIMQVRTEDDDVSFVCNYLTRELCEDMELFTYGPDDGWDWDDDIVLKDRELEEVKRALTARIHNNGAPPIVVEEADADCLCLLHDKSDPRPLDDLYAQKTLEYVYKVWKRPIILTTRDEEGQPLKYEVTKDGVAAEFQDEDGSKTRKFRI